MQMTQQPTAHAHVQEMTLSSGRHSRPGVAFQIRQWIKQKLAPTPFFGGHVGLSFGRLLFAAENEVSYIAEGALNTSPATGTLRLTIAFKFLAIAANSNHALQ